MNRENGWKTKISKERQDGQLNGVTGCLGNASASSPKTRTNSFRVGGNDSHKSNIPTTRTRETIPGGIARQLLEEAKKQLAYHKTQVNELEERIQELEELTEDLVEEKSEE